MKRLTNGSLTVWLLGAMMAVSLAAFTMAWNGVTGRMERMEGQLEGVGIKVDEIARRYSKIDVIDYRLERIEAYMAEQRLRDREALK